MNKTANNSEVGTVTKLGPITVTKEEIIEFAEEFDPVPFHLDEEAALKTPLKGLCASGWHTCSLAMRMMCDASLGADSGSQGSPGMEDCKWLMPVRPDDELSGTSTILSARQSGSRPEIRVVRNLVEIFNQNQETVLSMITIGLFLTSRDKNDEGAKS